MDVIRDRFDTTYTVTRSTLQADGTMVYYARAGDEAVARAVVQVFKGCISDVLVYKESDRGKGIASALYRLIEDDRNDNNACEYDRHFNHVHVVRRTIDDAIVPAVAPKDLDILVKRAAIFEQIGVHRPTAQSPPL